MEETTFGWPRKGSFLIRVRERQEGEWSGQVEHIQSGGRARFQTMDDLWDFMQHRMQTPESGRKWCERAVSEHGDR